MNNSEDTAICRLQSEWVPVGRLVNRSQKIVYRVRISPDAIIVEHLGAVKERPDGRWDWWRFETEFHLWDWPAQGVAATEQAAKAAVLSGWWPRPGAGA